MPSSSENGSAGRIDWLTVSSIGMLVYLVKNVVHEGVGHGLTCLAVGGKALGISSAWWHGDYAGVSAWGVRLEKAGGTLANLLLVAAIAVVWKPTQSLRKRHPTLGYFMWLTAVANLLSGGGYMMVDPIGNFGDWAGFLAGLEHQLPLRIMIVLVGVALSLMAVLVGRKQIEPFLGRIERTRRIRQLCWLPYFVGGAAFVVAALFNPLGNTYVFTTALATFGGTAWLAWFLPFTIEDEAATGAQPPAGIPRSRGWLVAGGISLLVTVAVLGPGVRF